MKKTIKMGKPLKNHDFAKITKMNFFTTLFSNFILLLKLTTRILAWIYLYVSVSLPLFFSLFFSVSFS